MTVQNQVDGATVERDRLAFDFAFGGYGRPVEIVQVVYTLQNDFDFEKLLKLLGIGSDFIEFVPQGFLPFGMQESSVPNNRNIVRRRAAIDILPIDHVEAAWAMSEEMAGVGFIMRDYGLVIVEYFMIGLEKIYHAFGCVS